MPPWVTRHAADLLTGLRIVMIPILVGAAWMAAESRVAGLVAAFAFSVAAASDVWDGRVARRHGRASDAGRWFDHFADIGFLLVVLAAYVALGLAPWWVPASVGAAFGVYAVDTRFGAPRPFSRVGSRIGHVGGVCNYVLVGVLVFNESVGLRLLPTWLMQALFLCVPLYSLAAIAVRLLTPPSNQSRDVRYANPRR